MPDQVSGSVVRQVEGQAVGVPHAREPEEGCTRGFRGRATRDPEGCVGVFVLDVPGAFQDALATELRRNERRQRIERSRI